MKRRYHFVGIIIGALAMGVAQVAAAAPSPLLDAKNWVAYKNVKDQYLQAQENIIQEKDGLKLLGFHLGGNPQYSLSAPLVAQFQNKLITVKFKFEGELVSPEASFIAFAVLPTSAQTIFWNQQCYAFLLKNNKVEIQKHGRGTNPNFQVKYEDFPGLGFKTLPVGKELTVSYGVIREGAFPRWVIKINGVEIFNGLDNKYGQTVRANPNNILIVGLFATNKEIAGDDSSKSSITIYNIE